MFYTVNLGGWQVSLCSSCKFFPNKKGNHLLRVFFLKTTRPPTQKLNFVGFCIQSQVLGLSSICTSQGPPPQAALIRQKSCTCKFICNWNAIEMQSTCKVICNWNAIDMQIYMQLKCIWYAFDMQLIWKLICNLYSIYMQLICNRYAIDMQLICNFICNFCSAQYAVIEFPFFCPVYGGVYEIKYAG